jgi:hypothetical protein
MIMTKIIKIVFLLLIIQVTISCSKGTNSCSICDKVWYSPKMQNQHYLSSKDGFRYSWITLNITDSGTFSPFSIAKGTPESNLMSINRGSSFSEGWVSRNKFKITEFQIRYYSNGTFPMLEKLFTYERKDTVVGGEPYELLLITSDSKTKRWISPKKH